MCCSKPFNRHTNQKPMAESWVDLEERITSTDIRKIKDNLLSDVDYILDKFGTVGQYYNETNPSSPEINKRLLEFRNIRVVLTGQEDEALMKQLYMECSRAKEIIEEDYQAFYVAFYKGLVLPFYGDTVGETPGYFGAYSYFLSNLWTLKQVLETGKNSGAEDKFDEYSKNVAEASSKPKNSDHYH